MEALYTAEATAYGEGRNGEVRSSDGVIDEVLSLPKEMGGPGGRLSRVDRRSGAARPMFHVQPDR
jgi:organic hydroperoxide reductase OsmC/OhrA